MATISRVTARQLVDCKGRPMVEVDVVTGDGILGRGSAPTGTSVGLHEARVLRDGNPEEYDGLSVHKAVACVKNRIAPALVGCDIFDQRMIDRIMIELDGTPDKGNLGGNAIYSTSIACLRAAAGSKGIPTYQHLCGKPVRTVPVPSFNVINGGKYDTLVQPFNEFIMVPYKADDIFHAVEIAITYFAALGKTLEKYLGKRPAVAGSYGWAAPSADPDAVLELMSEAAQTRNVRDKVAFALDCASSEMYDKSNNTYELLGERIAAADLITHVKRLTEKYPLIFVEDLLDEDDWDNYPKAAECITRTLLLGDDLTVSNPARIRRAFETKCIHGFVLKPNQVGTITEALDAHAYAREHGMISVPSGRSGGVVNDIIMDFAVGLEVGFIKNGAPRSGERIDKLNFLMRACDLQPECAMADIGPLVRF